MKKWFVFGLCMVLLSGCASEETFETVADELVQSVSAPMRQVVVRLPEEAAAPASESDSGCLYQCDGYEIMVQTLPAGDLDATIRSVSGYSRENVTVMETNTGDWKRYEFVWASAGEEGDRLGKAVILDDGSYHYAVSVLADADRCEEYEQVWKEMFSSLSLGQY